MPFYRAVGDLPPKRHRLDYHTNGEPLFEELIGEEGFSGAASLLYHLGVPSNLVNSRTWDLGDTKLTPNTPLLPRHFRLPDLFPEDSIKGNDVVRSRRQIMGNSDVRLSYVVADSTSPLYSNGVGDEVIFIESGSATLETIFGSIEVKQGDNVVIPSVTIHRWIPTNVETEGPLRAFCVEASGHVQFPKKHRSNIGQFLEGSPIIERDIRGPEGPLVASEDELHQDTDVYVRHYTESGIFGSIVTYDHHPFDVVAWDGHLYPYAFNYRDFSPVVGETLQPPPTYQVFEGAGFVVCNFVPRPLEFGDRSVKVPFYHQNVDSDEVMFYFAGETAAREGSGIATGSVSLHPAAYTHGPMREAYIDSVNHTEAKEMAFMVDTFVPLELAEGAFASDLPNYPWTWAGRGPKGAFDG